jgi:hypothetical protein
MHSKSHSDNNPRRSSEELERRIAELEFALGELLGSYLALCNQISSTGVGALHWNGPVCARRALGYEA